MHAQRKGRRLLEANPALLQVEADKELERLISAHADEKPEIKRQMHDHLLLIRDARRRDGSSVAICEAYINAYGGFTLDLPPWLADIEQRCSHLDRLRRPERTNRMRTAILRSALAYAYQDMNVAPEIIAELQNELAHTLVQSTHFDTQMAHIQALEEAIAYHEAALKIFIPDRYPLQYARTSLYLGNAYQQYSIITPRDTVERAIACYQAALRVCRRELYPEQWAYLQTQLGKAYTQRRLGVPAENLERAIVCHKAALRLATSASLPSIRAAAQVNLGDAYQQRIKGRRVDNLKLAMACYKAALQIYTPQTARKEWANVLSKQAFIFQCYVEESVERQDLYLRCAIVCYESALEVYSPESYPIEHAAMLVKLGNVHRKRPGGDRLTNLEQASKCYHRALQIFTLTAFPAQYHQTRLDLVKTEAQKRELIASGHTFTLSPTRV
jgi:tetratricopeptide (TPR) repeat protein